ncbi:MAG: tRNA (pseudouridine(54)-N(1))-methyltransferase TrmY [Methanolinea sp.]|jgi:tRNA (pseudouridine54-N1)-methyltransferase|nr:tRNA (pseudouridine(54)-N(1))-methyltransferase TrmY [Methanolinea sp.]
MIRIAVIGHLARTAGDFSLLDMPGGAGRMDIMCRCINSAFFLSHSLRRDVECYLLLRGPPGPDKIVRFMGDRLRSLNPDERSAGALIRKALAIPAGTEFRESSPGVEVKRGGPADLVSMAPFAVLDESGEDIRACSSLPENYILSDHLDFYPEEDALLKGQKRISVGPATLHADHAIIVLLNEIDRRRAGWT